MEILNLLANPLAEEEKLGLSFNKLCVCVHVKGGTKGHINFNEQFCASKLLPFN